MWLRAVAMTLSLALLTPSFGLAQTRFGGFVEYDNITYFEAPDSQKVNGRNQGILQLELRHTREMAEVFGAVEVRADQADPARNRVFLDEAYFDLYAGALDVRVGKQIYAWGRADAINPTDNLSVWDYSDVLDTEDERVGAVSLRADYYLGSWTVEGVLVPSFTPSTLPDTTSRWWPDFSAGIPNPEFPQRGPETLDVVYAFGEPLLPDEGLDSWQYAVKLAGSGGGWDYSISWFDGIDDLPGIRTVVDIDSVSGTGSATLRLEYHRRRAVGADFATTFGRVGVHGEAAYYISDDWEGVDPAIDDPYLHYVFGLDYTLRDVVAGNDLFLLIEWSQEFQVPDRNTEYGIFDLRHVFRRSLIGNADLDLGAFAKLALKGVWNVYAGDWWLQPGFEWSVTDGVQVRAAVDLLGGPDDSFFGMFDGNQRVQVRAKYSF
jgi:hypothetical protein